MNELKKCTVIALLAILPFVAAEANLISNPGFEDYDIHTVWSAGCDVTNWFGWSDVERVDSGWKAPYEETYTLVLKNWLGGNPGIEQKVDVSAEEAYLLTFNDLWDSGMDGTIDIEVRWLDNAWSQIGSNVFNGITLGAADTWNTQNFAVTSSVGSVHAEINIENNGGTTGAYYIDSIDFDAQAIPEPATVVFGVLGTCLLLLRRRRTM